LGGLPTALAELPVATTVIFRAVHHVAVEYGEDPDAEATCMECLAVFGAGGPGTDDDGVDTAFIGARLSLSGAAVNGLISRVAPRFAAVPHKSWRRKLCRFWVRPPVRAQIMPLSTIMWRWSMCILDCVNLRGRTEMPQ